MKFQLTFSALAALALAGVALAQSVEGLFQPSGTTWSCSPDQKGMDGGALAIQNGAATYWTRCDETDQSTTNEVARNTAKRWEYSNRTASIIVAGNQFGLSCNIFNTSSTYPTASASVPCPLCWPGETTSYVLRVDTGFTQSYEFERVSDAEGSVSDLDYASIWDAGLVQALMAGSLLEVVEAGNVIASFPLAASSRAIGAMRVSCN